jgi:hypothetical protein
MDFESLSLISVCSVDRDIPFQSYFEFVSYLEALTDPKNIVCSKSPSNAILNENREGVGYPKTTSHKYAILEEVISSLCPPY